MVGPTFRTKMTNSSANRTPLTVAALCDACASGKVNPSDRVHVKRQLEAEGEKRVESFLFDKMFFDALTASFGQNNVTGGWWRQANTRAAPYWIRLVTTDLPWNPVDDAIVRLLSEAREPALRVRWIEEGRQFRAIRLGEAASELTLSDQLTALVDNRRGNYFSRPYQGAGSTRALKAIDAIDKTFGDSEVQALSQSRLLVNCWLAPWANAQPMDIDAICLDSDKLVFLEFKRKYPTQAGLLSLDKIPHMQFAAWLDQFKLRLHNVVLVDPAWEKSLSPLYLLSAKSPARSHARWLGKVIEPDGSVRTVSTSGKDSGMSSGTRDQAAFPVDSYYLIGKGMDAPDLTSLVKDLTELSPATLADLVGARDEARKALGLKPL